MATYRRRGSSWQVLWKELVTLKHADGSVVRSWKQRSRTVTSEAVAKQLVAQVEALAAYGERWEDRREHAVATVRACCLGYVQAAVEARAPLSTQRFRSSMIGAFLDFLDAREETDPGAERPVTELSLTLIERFARSLASEGRQAQTQYRKVLEAERMWAWAFDRPERFPGVPLPRRYTGRPSDADKLSAPPPVVAVAAPTWEDIDRMISQLLIPWHRQAALVMRFTGLRASQVCGLSWEDLELERGILRVRSRVRGAKRSRARVIPLHPQLVEAMGRWSAPCEGLLFPRRYKSKDGAARTGPYRGDALTEPFRRAWTLAEVDEARWGAAGDREKASPTHAIRRCVRTQLIRAGVEEAVVLHLVGQSQGHTAAAYVPESCPQQSPYWPRLVEAVGRIPWAAFDDAGL